MKCLFAAAYESEYRKVKNTISRIYREERNMKWATVSWTDSAERERHHRRKEDFEPYTETFRPFHGNEITTILRCHPGSRILGTNAPLYTRTGEKIENGSELNYSNLYDIIQDCLVSYQAQLGGFTICNIIINNRLYSGSSHCIKSDRWLPIRGKMHAFRRALQSEGVEIPVLIPTLTSTTATTTTTGDEK